MSRARRLAKKALGERHPLGFAREQNRVAAQADADAAFFAQHLQELVVGPERAKQHGGVGHLDLRVHPNAGRQAPRWGHSGAHSRVHVGGEPSHAPAPGRLC